MRILRAAAVILFLALSVAANAQERQVYFSVSTNKTFLPGEKPSVRLYAHNVEVLEFRVYRVKDPLEFFEKMTDVHRFGPEHSPKERVDEKTLIERFHDWKHELWISLRDFIRWQFSSESRAAIRNRHSGTAVRTKGAGPADEFARVPLLNPTQLVARWKVHLPTALVSESSDLPMDSLESGAYLVEVTNGTYKAYTVLLVSKSMVVTKTSPGRMLAFTVDRKTGEPVANVKVTLWRNKAVGAQFNTDANGLGEARIEKKSTDAPPSEDGESSDSDWIMAQDGENVSFVAPYYSSFSLSSDPAADWLGYVYTDRPVYRPGHTVQFKAVMRKRNGDAVDLPTEREVRVEVTDAAQSVILRKQLPMSALGTLHGSLDLPANAALGSYSIRVIAGKAVGSGGGYGSFEVQEYKKPEYWVKVTPDKPRVLEGSTVTATIEARYFYGEPVANAKVKYVVHTSPKYYWENEEAPEDMPSAGAEGDGGEGGDSYYGGDQVEEKEAKLDANGRLVVTIPTRLDDKKMDVNYRIEARVTDAGNREVSGHNSVLATYGTYRVSIESQSYLYRASDSASLMVKAVDYDEHPVQAAVRVELVRQNKRQQVDVVRSVDATTGADGSAHIALPLGENGSFTVRVTSRTPEGREVTNSTWLWVSGNDNNWFGEERTIQLVADKASYKVGDTAHILVMDAVPDATLLVTAEGRTVISKQVVKSKSGSTIDIPITREGQPNLFVNVLFVHDDKLYQGKKNLKVPVSQQRLNIEIVPSKAQFIPGENAVYSVTAKDATGKPVQAELSFGVVDDAIYGIVPDTSGDILNALYPQRYGEVVTMHSLEFNFEGEAGKKSFQLADVFRAPRRSALAQIKAGDLVQPKVRKAFPDTAFWAPEVKTDANGHATVSLSFPDSLTTWRTTVRAVTMDTKGGASINKVIVRKNLILRMVVPRFFRQGDSVTVSTIVHNYLEGTKTAKISLAANGITLDDGGARDATIPSRGEVKLDWHLRTIPGKEVKLLAKALTNEESDAMELTLPIIPFGVKQAVSRSGAISGTVGQEQALLEFPSSAEPTSRGVDIELSPSIAGGIFGALDYLTSFPYGCTEQTMSSFLPNVVVAKTLTEMKLKSNIDPATLRNQVSAGLERLSDFQHDDGGWGWWKEDDSTVFMTAYVVSGLSQAKEAGYPVDGYKLRQAVEFLKKQLAEHQNMLADLRAYVVFALAQAGERDRGQLDSVWERREKLSAEGVAMIGLAMKLNNDSRAAEAASVLRSTMKTEGEGVYWPAKYDTLLDIHEDDSPESTAYAVKLLSAVNPNDELVPKAVQWLMRHRDEGYYWSSTKQTAMIVYAMADYLKVSHELDASFDAEVTVNGKSVAKKHFSAEDSINVGSVKVHLDASQLQAKNQVEIRKSGAGRLYWSARAPYYSTDKKLYRNGEFALNIARDYFRLTKVDTGVKIVYDLTPLSGTVAVGDILAVRVTVSGGKWSYLLVEDPIPAGTEFIQRDDLYELRSRPPWWENWYSRREFHDDRAAIFQTYFNQQHQYVYLLKVVNPGSFRTSPASVQPMYQPEVLSTTEPAGLEVK